jgi:hypothetical protein
MTPDDQAAVRALAKRGREAPEIARTLDLNFNAVRAIVDPVYRARCAERTRAWHVSLSSRFSRAPETDGLDLTGRLMGDRPPGRSWPKPIVHRSRHDIASDRELELRIRRTLARPDKRRPKPRREPAIPPMKVPPNPVRLLDHSRKQCARLVGADTMPGGDLLMCGRPVVPGTSWCRECKERVFQKKAA